MSWYNLNGSVQEIKGLEDTYFHDALRIPNWPTEQAAGQHKYTLNAAQNSAVLAAGVQLDLTGGGVTANPVTGGAAASTIAGTTGAAAGGLAHDLNPLNWIGSITGISSKNLVMRSVKVIIGGVLLLAGIMHMTGIDKDAAGVLTRTAGRLPT